MAGMLPGIECARRRRLHQGGAKARSSIGNGRSRHSTLCLYTSNHEQACLNSSCLMQRNINSWDDSKLDDTAKEAKEKLDERLIRNQWKLQAQR
ncbi:hypothetical protein Sjap_011010 [Stephania japonica]|uniref:Uncharacterized protein n=1 Tax=Stephania japonica TaxID=461633 RepID=A0AAP0P4N7_9MAGN